VRLEHLLSGEAEPEKRLEKTEFSLGTTRFVQYKKGKQPAAGTI
jgi:hypothetical protein